MGKDILITGLGHFTVERPKNGHFFLIFFFGLQMLTSTGDFIIGRSVS